MDGGHDIDRCAEVTEAVLREVFHQFAQQRVVLEGILLKPSMVLSGGQGDDETTANLRAVAARGTAIGAPWALSFSYGRALQALPMRT